MRYKHVHQLGFVVTDLNQAMTEYSRIYGVTTWYRAGKRKEDPIYYHGKPIHDPGFDLIVGYCGNTEIELITTAAEQSLYADFLRDREPGLNHVSFFVNDLDRAVQYMKNQGFQVIQNGYMSGKTERTDYAYSQTSSKYGKQKRRKQRKSECLSYDASLSIDIYRFSTVSEWTSGEQNCDQITGKGSDHYPRLLSNAVYV